jgi:hypothetical protein
MISLCAAALLAIPVVNRGGRQQMTFDYQLRPGVSPTTNALKLLDFVGLND